MSALHRTNEEWEQREAQKELDRAEEAVRRNGGPDRAGSAYNRDLDRAKERAKKAGIR